MKVHIGPIFFAISRCQLPPSSFRKRSAAQGSWCPVSPAGWSHGVPCRDLECSSRNGLRAERAPPSCDRIRETPHWLRTPARRLVRALRPPRPALAARAHRLPGMGVGDHAATDTGRYRARVLRAFRAPLPGRGRTRCGRGRRSAAPLERTGILRRARNLHRSARLIRERHGGEVPGDVAALKALPGIGASTAGDDPRPLPRRASCNPRRQRAAGAVPLSRHRRVAGAGAGAQTALGARRRTHPAPRRRRLHPGDHGLGRYPVHAAAPGLRPVPAGAGLPRPCPRPPARAAGAHARSATGRDGAPRSSSCAMPAARSSWSAGPRAACGAGLFGFPECRPASDVRAACEQRYGVEVKSTRRLGLVHHGFTPLCPGHRAPPRRGVPARNSGARRRRAGVVRARRRGGSRARRSRITAHRYTGARSRRGRASGGGHRGAGGRVCRDRPLNRPRREERLR